MSPSALPFPALGALLPTESLPPELLSAFNAAVFCAETSGNVFRLIVNWSPGSTPPTQTILPLIARLREERNACRAAILPVSSALTESRRGRPCQFSGVHAANAHMAALEMADSLYTAIWQCADPAGYARSCMDSSAIMNGTMLTKSFDKVCQFLRSFPFPEVGMVLGQIQGEAAQAAKSRQAITPSTGAAPTVTAQRKPKPKRENAKEQQPMPKPTGKAVNPRNVFVIHGRNEAARNAMFDFLRAMGLNPLEWGEARAFTGSASPYIGQILEAAFKNAQAVVAVLTGDDVAFLRPELQKADDPSHEKNPTPQARPNVLFEAGMAFGLHPTRTIIVEIGTLRPFTDVSGIHAVRFNGSPQSRTELKDRLKTAKCEVKDAGTDWLTAGNFEEAFKYTGPILVPGSTKLVFHGNSYYEAAADGKPKGAPFCSKCWETKKEAVHIAPHPIGDFSKCPNCKANYPVQEVFPA